MEIVFVLKRFLFGWSGIEILKKKKSPKKNNERKTKKQKKEKEKNTPRGAGGF